MSLFKSESRKTAIIEDAVGLEQSLIQQAQSQKKGKCQSKQKTTGGFRFSAPQDAGISKQTPAPKAKAKAKATPTTAPEKTTAKRKLDSASISTMPPQTTSKMRKLNPIDAAKPTKYSANQAPSMPKEQVQDRRVQPQVPASEVAHDTKSGQGGTSQGDEHRSANYRTQTVPKATSPQHPQYERPKLRMMSQKQSETRALNARSNLKNAQTVERATDTPTSHKGYEGVRPGHTSAPYLKSGRHDTGGDFDDDPARETGEGHQYEPEDMKRYEGFLQLRHRFYRMHRTYPKLHERERVDPRFKAAWDTEQMWYNRFTEKYPGARVDQWPCGCQKLSKGDESESESEEE